MEVPEEFSRGEKEEEKEEQCTAVLLLDHIRSHNRYIGLLERWTQQLQLTGRLLLGRHILVILQGVRPNIKVPAHTLHVHTVYHILDTSHEFKRSLLHKLDCITFILR